MPKLIRITSTGLLGGMPHQPFLAHERGNWGPENKDGDWLLHPMELSIDRHFFFIDGSFLQKEEEFKIIVHATSALDAMHIYQDRRSESGGLGLAMDYDIATWTYWILALFHPIVRPHEWNQCNVYMPDAPGW